MSNIDDFIARKHGKKEIVYTHPIMEPILKETYGIIVYQEQVMQIANEIAGFSLSEADITSSASTTLTRSRRLPIGPMMHS